MCQLEKLERKKEKSKYFIICTLLTFDKIQQFSALSVTANINES